MPRRLILVAATTFAAAAAPPAHAMTVRLGEPDLTARVSIALPVFVTCTPFDSPNVLQSESITAQVSQAVGKQIAHGTGSVFGSTNPGPMGGGPLLFPCDGTEQATTVTIPAATDGPPFKRDKQAVFTATASAFAIPPGCCFAGVQQNGSSGAVALKLK